jgi:hypothetical protein
VSSEDTVLGWLAPRQTLLVLDNCEHLLDGLPVLLERLLAGSPRLSVLLTSRARLLVPFEWVFLVPGLSIAAGDGGQGDAAMRLLLTPPEEFRTWASGMWRPWYAALWAEAERARGEAELAAMGATVMAWPPG